MNIADFLTGSARSFGERPAVTWRGTTLSYAEANEESARLGQVMRGLGVGRGDRVLTYMDNRPELLLALFAIFRIGAVAVPCNSRSTIDDIRYLLDDSGGLLVVADHGRAVDLASAVEQDRILDVDSAWKAGRETEAPELSQAIEMEPDEVAWLFYTSGTTGRPKGAMLSHAVLNFVTVSWLADITPLDENDVTLHAAPLSHGAGFHALVATARAAHQVIPDQPSFDPVKTLELIREYGVTNTWMVPTQIVRLTAAAGEARDIPTLRYLVYGGAPMAPAAIQRAIDAFGPIFVQLYAQGESPMTITVLRPQDHHPDRLGTVGRARLGVELAVVGQDGERLPPGSVGEVTVRGPSVMRGYWERPEASSETLRDGWLHTGDLGQLDEQGYLTLLDRTKDMIISGGSNVYAVEVEAALSTSDSVVDVAVVGVSDDLWGERVEAVVVLADGISLDGAELDTLARASLADYKIPRCYHRIDDIPRNAYGKIQKRDLREMLEALHQAPEQKEAM